MNSEHLPEWGQGIVAAREDKKQEAITDFLFGFKSWHHVTWSRSKSTLCDFRSQPKSQVTGAVRSGPKMAWPSDFQFSSQAVATLGQERFCNRGTGYSRLNLAILPSSHKRENAQGILRRACGKKKMALFHSFSRRPCWNILGYRIWSIATRCASRLSPGVSHNIPHVLCTDQ